MNTILRPAWGGHGAAGAHLRASEMHAVPLKKGRDKEGGRAGGLQMRRYRSSPNLGRQQAPLILSRHPQRANKLAPDMMGNLGGHGLVV